MNYLCQVNRITFFTIILIFITAFCGAEIDEDTIKVGIRRDDQFTTVRMQSFSGNWVLQMTPVASATNQAMVSEQLIEGEDASLLMVPKGIVVKLSTEKNLESGFKKVVIEGGELVSIEIPGQAPLILQGRVEIDNDGVTLSISNTVNLHQFIVSCVSNLANWNEPEAIKALIVMVRTRLKFLKDNPAHKDQPYEICDEEHCLLFPGCGYNRELVDILTTMTRNMILIYKGKVIMPRFHNTCGGKISSAKEIYGVENEPYHVAHNDLQDGKGSENCFHSPNFYWSVELQKPDLLNFLSSAFAGGADRIYGRWEPEKIDANGRIYQILLGGRKPKSVSGIDFFEQLQNNFGPNSIKSMKFNMDILKRSIIFRGMGQGNGVGMCLYGADGLGKKGVKYNDILKFYYPGTDIK